eukprot:82649_1
MTVNPDLMKMNDIQRGALLFQIKCQRCHANKKGDSHRRGPNLFGVIGRIAGRSGYHKYSPELTATNILWTRKTIKEYMKNPQRMVCNILHFVFTHYLASFKVPGTGMFYGAALPASVQSDCIVTYLESISPGFQQNIDKHQRKRKVQEDLEKVSKLGGHPEVPLFGEK